MKRQEINIRDPYILVHNENYYLYGTRSQTTWSDADGFDCYVSQNLTDWEGPIEIFKRTDDFFATQNFWAPEVYAYQNAFYMVTTLGAKNQTKGIYVLKADQPIGPFELISDRLTPENWAAIDGTLYFEKETPYLIFSHSFETSPDGDMCLLPLNKDLTSVREEHPLTLFSAKEASWAKPVPFAKEEFGMDEDVYFTDGPSLFKDEQNDLYMIWSSWSTTGYAVGLAQSETGSVIGPWQQLPDLLFGENGGHAMVFKDLNQTLRFAYHFPNDHYREKPQFAELIQKHNSYKLINRTDLLED
ncbi:glycoside hydrolase family 43 protein [Streptococcus sp. S784/96/1]|uniref:glycoside hydrolase family 43 protein n=1 Tax=Streptococcus sp. S784/96/1 TaxID=2653499 RepID=UPI001389BAEC|nr:glycoside hydrolase family 43 protein [Streptococcus sp. S784/96/1]